MLEMSSNLFLKGVVLKILKLKYSTVICDLKY